MDIHWASAEQGKLSSLIYISICKFSFRNHLIDNKLSQELNGRELIQKAARMYNIDLVSKVYPPPPEACKRKKSTQYIHMGESFQDYS